MSWATSEAVAVLTFLLPGLVGATIFYSLTSHPKPSEIERIVHALAFTILAQGIAWIVFELADLSREVNSQNEGLETVVSLGSAIFLALLLAYGANHDLPHRLLRKVGGTKETSYPSEWYSAFYRYHDLYIVLHLKGDRRLYGWAGEWPGHPEQGHFVMAECEWLIGEERLPVTGVSRLLISGQEVEMVEFLRGPEIQLPED